MLAGKRVAVSPFINGYSHGVSGQSAPKDIETAFQLAYLFFADPRFDQDEYQVGIQQIEAVLPNEYCYEGHKQVVGFVYALDTRKPVVKEYMGGLRTACLNLCTFNPAALSVQELQPEHAIDYNFLNYCLELVDDMGVKLRQLENMEFTKEQMFNELGQQIDRCINFKFHNDFGTVKLPESLPIEVYKNLFYNEKSDYFTQNDIVSGFDVYQAYTDIICNGKSKDLVNRFEKTFLVSRIMGVN